ncbi:ATP-binding cassette, subfamily C, CydD [Novosphingobium sp. CF614]|uniref:thiol reductant ABC exporter subunit CydD n=1 Tax=Novosphingobium sp. CF614 TaxID=1884364 RepID=UPI0008DED64B|nr:thiol reductant ABC exporter subunit CydD [Novosphingobium sp. CF614]SFG13964.1 ATP-binding cassette, subfamily C, CydD [Novosphingobium sp. CF614]
MTSNRAFLFWLLDGVLAIAVAAALALAVTCLTEGPFGGERLLAPLLLVAACLCRAQVQVLATTAGQRDAAREKHTWRTRAIGAVLRAPAGSRAMLGERTADATDRIEDLDGYHARFRPLRFAAVATPLAVAAAAALASWVAATILLATLVPFGLGMALAGTAAARAAARQLDALSKLSGLFIDRVRALPIVIGFGAQERVVRQLSGATQEVARRTLAVLRVAFLSSAVVEFFAALSVALVAVYCGFSLLGLLPFPAPETLTLGRALFVLVLAPEFYLPMRRLAAAYHDKQIGEAALDRLSCLAPSPGSHMAPAVNQDSPPRLCFSAVEIDYGDRKLGPFTFDVPAGELTVLSGPSGAGKSSLLNALLGLAPVTTGEILIDNLPLAATRLQGQVSWAGQATTFLPGTLGDNIRLARPGASDAEVEDAAHKVSLAALLSARAAGLDMLIDPHGSGLSGGERRRVGMARAVLRDAPLWLLDEPTADLDAASASDLIALVQTAARGRTVLLVTHDPEIAALADHHVAIA